ncbi:NADPH-dependent 2,4-dienoyl-CoA reductase/sulfur reductase-like enzyme [Breznakia sp. PF5-3]|uniref:H2O-forming NADH oxidase n=1 Tax=unclassified Breznakia TaxID=2623764 RepID=UPI002404CB47|nr:MULTISPECIES: FAD-dependent oxidoreductase [unclassified Breznakia]MDF9823945.1 NADPH-dependent 2,4-dienoyl-CoA reductase/sulfur reductase-like enzyme [Breznakia sp. PM6-1]MDF9834744.1 NADPH-dependent 2,4-dienoyl-CoA reductase/sulfur reductase-like enzyme [Breznakia sp. PF5-3]MDF9836820.1 NADPH-dependent 2,4-dienoyl-CoA reductase/sulfur reductase-like enzyme [Breznakia sp. PFB2-8]MDF9858838.1 NADPH-dependent 2,4-dienoyl-CoA reductase/sulfur reductase-like enzyme [Breznakia sp. PH5-24]
MEKIVVIGANHAGTAAINTMLDTYKDIDVSVFDANSNISFLGCGMALWIGDQIHGSDGLFYSSREAMEEKGAKVYMETPVEHINYDKKVVYAKTKDGKEIEQPYDKLILATGSLPVKPNIKGMDLNNVQFVKLFQNAQEVIDKLDVQKDIHHVTIVGAGYIGVELAEAFKRKGKLVQIIDVAEHSLANYYDSEFTDIMDENLHTHGIKLSYNETVKALEGTTKVEKIITDKNSYNTDMVVFAVGFKPNNVLGNEHLKLYKNGAFIVDKTQKTSDDSVYAIGDCATVYDNAIQDINYIALATNAVRSGIVAAHNVCGTHLESAGVQGSNGIRIWDINMVSTGLTLKKALEHGYDADVTDFEDYQKPLFIEHDNEKVKIRIVYDKNTRRILGAQLCSKYDISMNIHMFSLAIQEGLTIDKLKLLDIFFLPHFNQPYNYITMATLQAK